MALFYAFCRRASSHQRRSCRLLGGQGGRRSLSGGRPGFSVSLSARRRAAAAPDGRAVSKELSDRFAPCIFSLPFGPFAAAVLPAEASWQPAWLSRPFTVSLGSAGPRIISTPADCVIGSRKVRRRHAMIPAYMAEQVRPLYGAAGRLYLPEYRPPSAGAAA